MPNQITINTDNSQINIDEGGNSQINIDEGGTRVITIVGAGPQGPAGPVGPQGPSGNVGDSESLPGSLGPQYPLNSTVIYLNIDTVLESTQVISNDTIHVVGSFASVPTGFPSLTKNDFRYYINGVFIQPSNVVSLTDTKTHCEVVFNTSSMGYSLETGDNLTIIGKFNPSSFSGFSSGFSSGFNSGLSPEYNFVSSSSILIFT